MMLWKVNDPSLVFCPNCHIRMIELHRTVFQCYKCGVKIMKNEAVADYELEREEEYPMPNHVHNILKIRSKKGE